MSSYPSRIASPPTGGVGLGSGHGGGGSNATSATVTLFRRLVWEGSIPLEIRIDQKELPADSDRGLGECYYVQVPRISYLPLIVPELKQYLLELVLSEREGANIKEEQWWFEDEFGGIVKWNWPIGLLYDIYISSKTVSLASSYPASASSSSPTPTQPLVHPQPTFPLRLTLHLAPLGGGEKSTHGMLGPGNMEALKQSFMAQLKEADFLRWGSTKRVTGLRKAEQDGIWDALREHSFEDFWRISSRIHPSPAAPPMTNAHLQSPSSYNPQGTISSHSRPPSTDPATSVPREDRDTAYSVRSIPIRIYLPDLPNNPSSSSSPRAGSSNLPGGSSFSTGSAFASTGYGGGASMSAYHPHLAGGSLASFACTLPGSAGTGTVIQPLVPPLLGDSTPGSQTTSNPSSPKLMSSPLGGNPSNTPAGQPATLRSLLETQFPLLFSGSEMGNGVVFAHAIVQGVVVPLETDLAWLGSCLSGADGWVGIVVGLGRGA